MVLTAEHPDDGERLAQLLTRAGLELSAANGLLVVAARTIFSSELRRINRRQLRRGEPWLLLKVSGEDVWAGPLFSPYETGCWECLAVRLVENGWTDSSDAAAPRLIDAAARAAARGTTPLAGRLLAFGQSAELRIHELTRRPQCPACGEPAITSCRAVSLKRRIRLPGSTRTATAADAIERLAPHASELTGIVSDLAPLTGWNGLPMVSALHCRPLAARASGGNPRQPVSGSGASLVDAAASCLAEAVERYSIQWQGEPPARRAKQSSLGGCAIGLAELGLVSARQVRHRTEWNRRVGGLSYIPKLPAADSRMDWREVWSLTGAAPRYVPASYCELYYPDAGWLADSNGCAAGSTLEEAILSGFLELVERDAVAIWWYNRLRRPAVRVDGRMRRRHESLCRGLERRGRSLTVLDLTADFGIPTFAAVSAQEGRRIGIGTGAHLRADVALERAVGELCQFLQGIDAARPARPRTAVERAIRQWLAGATLAKNPYLTPSAGSIDLSAFPDRPQPDVRKDIEWCVARARELGLEVLVLDMTRPEIGLPVARVIVPGMRHCWARLAPGRLYDVPVKMGWLTRPLREAELNPQAYFL